MVRCWLILRRRWWRGGLPSPAPRRFGLVPWPLLVLCAPIIVPVRIPWPGVKTVLSTRRRTVPIPTGTHACLLGLFFCAEIFFPFPAFFPGVVLVPTIPLAQPAFIRPHLGQIGEPSGRQRPTPTAATLRITSAIVGSSPVLSGLVPTLSVAIPPSNRHHRPCGFLVLTVVGPKILAEVAGGAVLPIVLGIASVPLRPCWHILRPSLALDRPLSLSAPPSPLSPYGPHLALRSSW